MPMARRKEVAYWEPGSYWVKVHSILEATTQYGPGYQIFFEAQDGKYEGQRLPNIYPQQYTAKNKLGRLLVTLGYDVEREEEVNLNRIIDEELLITVEDRKTERGIFSKITEYTKHKPGGERE